MTNTPEHIAQLLYGRLNGTLTGTEQAELQEWIEAADRSPLFAGDMHDETVIARWVSDYNRDQEVNRENIVLQQVLQQIHARKHSAEPVKEEKEAVDGPPAHRMRFLTIGWLRYAAAVIIILASALIYYSFFYTSGSDSKIVQTIPSVAADILPGYNRAVLTLSNGKKVELDSAASETIKDGTLAIENNKGQLIYKNDGVVAMNTMSTPRGGQYRLTLADGTNVWLNAASSITYPTAFTSNTREVTISGEAYFEVKKNPSKPFVVRTPQEDIVVLGTSFNVNAYTDEEAVKISLLEGSVKVANTVLKPGQAFKNGNIIRTNVEQDVAWKNGVFDFNDLRGDQVMRQLARWYDIEIMYPETIERVRFGGEIDRHLTLNDVLTGLEGIGGLKFKLHGRKVIVKR